MSPIHMSIVEFCQYTGISLSAFYKIRRNGTGPAITFVGGRRFIRRETAEAWASALPQSSTSGENAGKRAA